MTIFDTHWTRNGAIALLLGTLLSPGCQQEMGKQPAYRPLEPSTFFPDGRSARPLLPGTVARGQVSPQSPLQTPWGSQRSDPTPVVTLVMQGFANPLGVLSVLPVVDRILAVGSYTAEFPFQVTEAILARGRERYDIYCVVCHDPTGNGDGIIVQRGYTHPPSYIFDHSRGFERRGISILLRDVPVGYFFEVITNGYGAMPDYRSQVPLRDRWAIVAYIRAIQLSQFARVQSLPRQERRRIENALEGSR